VLGILLRDEAERAIGGEAFLDELQRGAARDEQRHDGGGKDDHAAQREDGELGRHGDLRDVVVEAEVARRPEPARAWLLPLLLVGHRETLLTQRSRGHKASRASTGRDVADTVSTCLRVRLRSSRRMRACRGWPSSWSGSSAARFVSTPRATRSRTTGRRAPT